MAISGTGSVNDYVQKYAAGETGKTSKTGGNYGKTVGNPKLSEEGQKYYEELKKKYSGMDFVLVSKDQVSTAEIQAAKYANPNRTLVLIDDEKIERMATDEEYRKKYEGIIDRASKSLSQFEKQLKQSGANVKGYGIRVNEDGTTSLFATLKKSSAEQKARIEKKATEAKEAKKAEAKKAEAKKAKKDVKNENVNEEDNEDTVTITANSIEELMKKIEDYSYANKSNSVQTESEKLVGQFIDFKG